MDYSKHYEALIAKYGTWDKPKDVYVERHRKLPGNANGKYVKGNAFYMTARAHYVAHLLLAKITNRPKDWEAVKGMCEFKGRTTSRAYETARIKALPAMRENGLRAAKLLIELGKGITAMSFEDRSERSRKTAIRMMKEGKGLAALTKEQRRDGGLKAFSNKTGVHARTKEQMITDASKGGKTISDRNLGFLIPGAARTAGNRSVELKRGIHGQSSAQRSANSVKAATATNALLYRCLECGIEKRPCELGHHQKSTGHSGKVKVI